MSDNLTYSNIQTFVCDDLLQLNTNDFTLDSNLLYLGLDSLKMMRLVQFLEESFQITIKDEDVNGKNMTSVRSITELVDRYLCATKL